MLGATYQPRGGIARHENVAWGYARAADALGVDLVQGCEVTGIEVRDGRAVAVETTLGPDRREHGSRSSPPGTARCSRGWPASRLPVQTHPLQALVSELYEQVLDTVVMSNAVHVYVSQAHKGELVMGAGIDAYNSYAQRGSFHVIEHQLAAAIELFPIFASARVLRTWAGIVDVCPDASPIVGPTPVDGLYVNCGWGTGGFKATPGSGWAFAWTLAHGEPHPLERAVPARPLHDRRADRRARRRRGRALMLLIRCPWCGERDEVEFSYGGQAGDRLPGRPGRALRRGVGAVPLLPRQPEGRVRRAVGAHARLPPLVRRSSATR